MRIRRLTLCPYRNFAALDLSFGEDHALITGANGRGKSNILEAISYLSIGKSIRGARDQEVIPHGGQYFDVCADWFDGQREHQLRVFYGSSEGKRVFLDGAPLERISDIVSLFQTVQFSPEDVALVLQFSGQRRRLLDILLSQASGEYLRGLQRYQRVLSQRNQYLRQGPRSRTDELIVWDGQLAELGGKLRRQRLMALVEMWDAFTAAYKRFSTGRERAGYTYQGAEVEAASEVPDEAALGAGLERELADQFDRERRAGFSLSGPHRDAFAFTLDGEPADTYGSQGQLKSVLVSWKMAELRLLEARSGQVPVLLLDDVFSELDSERSEQLLSMVDDFEQVILTSPRPVVEVEAAPFERIALDA